MKPDKWFLAGDMLLVVAPNTACFYEDEMHPNVFHEDGRGWISSARVVDDLLHSMKQGRGLEDRGPEYRWTMQFSSRIVFR